MERVYVLIQVVPWGERFTVLGAFRDIQEAHAEARRLGVDQCRVLQTDLK